MSGGYTALGGEGVHTADLFDSVFSAHHAYIYKLAHALLGNTQDAEDVTQEVFLAVYKALPTFDPERGSIRTWLSTIAVNSCKRYRHRNFFHHMWRSRPSDDGDDEGLEPCDPSLLGAPEDQALQSELRKAIKDLLAKLGSEHRTVLVLHYYMDLSCTEIAGIMACPEGTIYSRLHHARRQVRSHLTRQSNGLNYGVYSEVEAGYPLLHDQSILLATGGMPGEAAVHRVGARLQSHL